MISQPSLNKKNIRQVAQRAIAFVKRETKQETRRKKRITEPLPENPMDEAIDNLVMQATLVVIGSCFAAAIILVSIAILLTPHS